MEDNKLAFDSKRGIVIGIAAGVASATIIGTFNLSMRWNTRREQVQFIREAIVTNFTRIGNAKDILHPNKNTVLIRADRMRFAYFENLFRELQLIASYRMTELDYAQVAELQRELIDFNILFELFKNKSPSESNALNPYQDRYEAFVKISWLDLPKEPPWTVKSSP